MLNVVHTGHGSQIWQAYDDAAQRLVGVKTLRDSSDHDADNIRLLRQEYLVGRDIKDPRIIEMYTFGWDRGLPYLGMEWFSAPNMKQRMLADADKIAPLLPKIIENAAAALDHFNRLGWVHRDIKPDNFLVTDDGDVKLIDFALAKRRPNGLMRLLTPRKKIQQGTKSYMSPEQIRGLPLDQRADLYSFACTIFELVAGKPPFTGTSVNDLLTKHLKTTPPSLEAQNPNVMPAFGQLIRRCMAKKASARPETVGDFLREFRMMRPFRSMPTGNS